MFFVLFLENDKRKSQNEFLNIILKVDVIHWHKFESLFFLPFSAFMPYLTRARWRWRSSFRLHGHQRWIMPSCLVLDCHLHHRFRHLACFCWALQQIRSTCFNQLTLLMTLRSRNWCRWRRHGSWEPDSRGCFLATQHQAYSLGLFARGNRWYRRHPCAFRY